MHGMMDDIDFIDQLNQELLDACDTGEYDDVVWLVASGADVKHGETTSSLLQSDQSPLRSAVHNGNANVCGFLLDQGANIHTEVNIYGRPMSFLYHAVHMGHEKLVQLLVERGLDRKITSNRTPQGRTTLDVGEGTSQKMMFISELLYKKVKEQHG